MSSSLLACLIILAFQKSGACYIKSRQMPKGVDRLKGQHGYQKHTFKPWEMGKNLQQAEGTQNIYG